MQFKESGQRSGIQHLKSRIRDCLGFPYMGRGVGTLLYTCIDKKTMRKVKFLVLGNDRMACPWLSVYDSTNTPPSDSSDILKKSTSQTLYSNTLYHWQRFLRPFYCWIDLPSTCLFGKCWNGHKLRDIGVNRLIWQQSGNVSWRRRAQIKQLAWPMAERQIGQRKSSLVVFTRFPVVK